MGRTRCAASSSSALAEGADEGGSLHTLCALAEGAAEGSALQALWSALELEGAGACGARLAIVAQEPALICFGGEQRRGWNSLWFCTARVPPYGGTLFIG